MRWAGRSGEGRRVGQGGKEMEFAYNKYTIMGHFRFADSYK